MSEGLVAARRGQSFFPAAETAIASFLSPDVTPGCRPEPHLRQKITEDVPVRAVITQGTAADCKKARALIDGFSSQHLLADRGYDTNETLCQAVNQGMIPVIPPKKNRKKARESMTKNSLKHDIASSTLFFT